jgi:hypothetical protein
LAFQAAPDIILKMTERYQRALVYGGLTLVVTAMWLALAKHHLKQRPFSLTPIKEVNLGGSNIVVFRMMSSKAHWMTIKDLSILVPDDSESAHRQKWKPSHFPPVWTTNFPSTPFKRELTFSIVEPTNQVWALGAYFGATVPVNIWMERAKQECTCLNHLNFSKMRSAWFVPTHISLHVVMSPGLTNTVSAELAQRY